MILGNTRIMTDERREWQIDLARQVQDWRLLTGKVSCRICRDCGNADMQNREGFTSAFSIAGRVVWCATAGLNDGTIIKQELGVTCGRPRFGIGTG